MSELQQIVSLWRAAKAREEEVCLATVVRVEGSSYRKPGARMLITRSGQRAGTISGGCLEAEVQKKAWWLTENGPAIQRYSSFFDDDSPMPYGLGCGGTVYVLLERGEPAHAVLSALDANLCSRAQFVIVTDTDQAGTIWIQRTDGERSFSADSPLQPGAASLARRAARERHSFYAKNLFVEFKAPPSALTIFGAGDDAKPLVGFANQLGWHVTVADGRSHLAHAERFPHADRLVVLDYEASEPLRELRIDSEDAFVLLTHSYEQDRTLLSELLPGKPRYLGVLGPRQRTERLIAEVAPLIGQSTEECMSSLHAPIGFDIGAHAPETIALSIITEIVAVLNGRDGASLKKSKQIHAQLHHV